MLQNLLNLIYPDFCSLCKDKASAGLPFCDSCASSFRFIKMPVCVKCGIEMGLASDTVPACDVCQREDFAFDGALSVLAYDDTARKTIHLFKYHKRFRIGSWLADMMSSLIEKHPLPAKIDLITKTPMHWTKFWLKGINPCHFLASEVSKRLKIKYEPNVIARSRPGKSQTNLSRPERFINVENAFRGKACLKNKSVLLVDDVMTSGATANECARALKKYGAGKVFVVTAARALVK